MNKKTQKYIVIGIISSIGLGIFFFVKIMDNKSTTLYEWLKNLLAGAYTT